MWKGLYHLCETKLTTKAMNITAIFVKVFLRSLNVPRMCINPNANPNLNLTVTLGFIHIFGGFKNEETVGGTIFKLFQGFNFTFTSVAR